MKGKAFWAIIMTLLFNGALTLAFNVQIVGAPETIYIRADGSVDPPTAPILNIGNVSYAFTRIKIDKTYPTIETPSRTPEDDALPDQTVKVLVNVTDATSGLENVTLHYITPLTMEQHGKKPQYQRNLLKHG